MTRIPRPIALALVFTLPSAVLVLGAALVHHHYRIDPPSRLGAASRIAAVAVVRAALTDRTRAPAAPTEPGLTGLPLAEHGPAVVTLWLDGKAAARAEGRGATAAAAVLAAGTALQRDPAIGKLDDAARTRGRIQIDLVVGRGPILESPEVLSLFSLHPGLEGLAVVLPDERELLTGPDELIRTKALFARRPVKAIPDLNLGLDWPAIEKAFAERAGLSPAAYAALDKRYVRIRVDGFVEQPADRRQLPPPPLATRGIPPAPPRTAANLRAAAIEGGRYLVRHLSPAGRYVYEVDLATGTATDPNVPKPYSLPRHAGTTYYLAELYRHTHEEFLKEPIERAFGHLAKLVNDGGCRGQTPDGHAYACVVDKGQNRAVLGSTALAVVALVEYRRATGNATYDELAKQLTEWMLWLQRGDGTFAHIFEVRAKKPDWDTQLLYFSGEAALALARMYEVHKDPRYIKATERALDYLTRWYDFFSGGFFYGEEHWTCIASAAAWPALKHRRYLDFCLGYGDFLRRQQVKPGELPDQEDLVGTFGFSPFVVPSNTPAGSRTEAMLSTYELARFHGEDPEDLRDQILRSVQYTMGQQVRPESDFASAPAADGLGAVPSSPLDRKVRIDFVQHVCSSLIRAAPIAEAHPPASATDPG